MIVVLTPVLILVVIHVFVILQYLTPINHSVLLMAKILIANVQLVLIVTLIICALLMAQVNTLASHLILKNLVLQIPPLLLALIIALLLTILLKLLLQQWQHILMHINVHQTVIIFVLALLQVVHLLLVPQLLELQTVIAKPILIIKVVLTSAQVLLINVPASLQYLIPINQFAHRMAKILIANAQLMVTLILLVHQIIPTNMNASHRVLHKFVQQIVQILLVLRPAQ